MLKAKQLLTDTDTAGLIKLNYPEKLEDLIGQFKGKVVYIDLLASWCTPCIDEFKQAYELVPFFKKNNIVKLYVTIDNQEMIEKAYKIIQEASLDGYFLSYHNPQKRTVSSEFSLFIEKLLYQNEDGGAERSTFSIAIYAIFRIKKEISWLRMHSDNRQKRSA